MIQGESLEIVVNVHHFAQQIVDYLTENDNFGVDIRISDEQDMLLDTGGGLKKAISLYDNSKPILIHNVDILSNLDTTDFYYRASKTISEGANIGAVLEVSRRESSRYLLFDKNKKLCGWTNVKTGEIKSPYPSIDVNELDRYAFSGIHVVNPTRLLPILETWEEKFPIIDFYLSVCDKIDILCEPNDNLSLVDVGKLETLNYLCNENLNSLT